MADKQINALGTEVSVAAGDKFPTQRAADNATHYATGQQLKDFVQNATGVAANTYGDSTHVAQVSVGADGRITGVTLIPISATQNYAPSRLTFFGHSYLQFDASDPYYTDMHPETTVFALTPNKRGKLGWNLIVNDALGLPGPQYLVAQVPGSTSNGQLLETMLGVTNDEALIEGVWYAPISAFNGVATNNRSLELRVPGGFGAQTIMHYPMIAGTNLEVWSATSTTPLGLNSLMTTGVSINGGKLGTRGVSNDYLPPVRDIPNNHGLGIVVPGGTVLTWRSVAVGSGMQDPGGLVIVRLGTRVRNGAIGGSSLMYSGCYMGGWTTAMLWKNNRSAIGGTTVNTTAAAAAGSNVTVNVDAGESAIGNGEVLTFSNGATATVTGGNVAPGALSFLATVSGNIPIGDQGTSGSPYSPATPPATYVLGWGINDAGLRTPPDLSAWRESMRATIAWLSCPHYSESVRSSNIQYNPGNGFAAWATTNCGVAAGLSSLTHFPHEGTVKVFTGSIGGTKPTITIKISPGNMDGTVVDLFFAAVTGTSKGAQATIKVDNGDPVTGPCRVDTSGVATLLDTAPLGGVFSNFWAGAHPMTVAVTQNSPNIVRTSAGGGFSDPQDIGRWVTGGGGPTGIPVGASFLRKIAGTTVSGLNNTTNPVTFTVVDAATPFPQSAPFDVTVGNEVLTVTAGAGTLSWTANRAQKGTAAAPHADGSVAQMAILSANYTAASNNAYPINMLPFIPMVKRITGLTRRQGHTITVTIDSIDSAVADAMFFFMGYGVETSTPKTGVVVCNTPKITNTTTYAVGNTDSNVNALNAETLTVLAGTAAKVGVNTTEPALPSTVLYVDLDVLIQKNADYFASDGIHPSPRGAQIIAGAVIDAVRQLPTQTLESR